MESESDRQVVGYHCEVRHLEVFEPDNELPRTQFLLAVKAIIFSSQPAALHSEDEDDGEHYEGTYSEELELELDFLMDEDRSRAALAEALVSFLHVPPQICDSVVEKIVQESLDAETDSRPYSDDMFVQMAAFITVVVDDEFEGLETDDPKFVPASKSSIEKLKRARVEVSATCSVCMEEMEVGSQAIHMPCSHLYHKDCIVEWLDKSRVCPLCRFAMPSK
ncbi:E3 ubiquitin-protein ligase SDIR1-like [Pyrus x bretschneideri]|uniref:E3 ubiquitin-protein ligase SDIR1-like n=1 Tax=Pyrus x bretschneideri TaxID=225117 RepID=UPI00202F033B|nr:E3 ubiquitin-protein ligase SDIR1-like [Pyrus x bretschneideri]